MDIIELFDDFKGKIFQYGGLEYGNFEDALAAKEKRNSKNKKSPEALAKIRSSTENSIRQRRFEANQGSKPDPIYHEIEIALMALDSPTEPDRSRQATKAELKTVIDSFFAEKEEICRVQIREFLEEARCVEWGDEEPNFVIKFSEDALKALQTAFLRSLVNEEIEALPEGESIEQYKKRLKREDAAYQAALERYEKEVEKIEAPLRAHEQRLEAEIQREVDFEMSQIMKG